MTQSSELIWHNGEMIPYQQATTHVLSHALHYGSSVFEGVRAYDTPNGPAIFRLTDHLKRLYDSAKIYRMEIPFTLEQLTQACKDAVKQNGFSDAYLRPFAFLGHVGLGINPKSRVADVTVAAMQWGAYLGEDSLAQGVDVCISSWNRLAPNTMPTAAKAGGNYLSSQLISGEAKRNGYVEGIALDTNGLLSEGAGENLFVIKNGVLYTPPTTACILPGLTRDTIMTLAKERGFEVREEAIAREALYLADEFFMTGTAAEIVPVRSVDQIPVGQGARGPITEELQAAYFALVKGQSPDPRGWLEYVND
ncbi:branched-chain amino acid transaminase [Pseudoalteromonas sp. T1lg76]|uniref:branched-chain amino acid transaminase n=1 Tax=Pseudoalteromonas sp. T1lg76 TaxID=2077103 RepID=UPI000CF5F2C7|nr:branched-chain amino acid transaminase [Pseudoalteromonas sp. T1lg76]